jgi:uncharacterized protein (DUF2267 family)
MEYERFLDLVGARAGLDDRHESARTAQVVLQALVDRLTGDEARDMLAQLPYQLKTAVTVAEAPTGWSSDEFAAWVSEKLHVPEPEARARVRAVFSTLREALSEGEFRDMLEQLDPPYADLLG